MRSHDFQLKKNSFWFLNQYPWQDPLGKYCMKGVCGQTQEIINRKTYFHIPLIASFHNFAKISIHVLGHFSIALLKEIKEIIYCLIEPQEQEWIFGSAMLDSDQKKQQLETKKPNFML